MSTGLTGRPKRCGLRAVDDAEVSYRTFGGTARVAADGVPASSCGDVALAMRREGGEDEAGGAAIGSRVRPLGRTRRSAGGCAARAAWRSPPAAASSSSTSRRLSVERKYSQIACWMMAFGKRKPGYGDVKPNLTKPAIVLVAEGGGRGEGVISRPFWLWARAAVPGRRAGYRQICWCR